MSSLSGSGSVKRGPNGYFETVFAARPGARKGRELDANERLLLHCARRGDPEGVGECLARGADPNCHDNAQGQNALMIAVEEGAIECVEALAAHPRMDLAAKDSKGASAWIQAAQAAEPECMAALARALAAREAAEPSLAGWARASDAAGRDALMAAIGAGCEGCARIARESGADPRARDARGATALMAAASSGSQRMLGAALPGSDPLARDDSGRDALMEAAWAGFEAGVEALLPMSNPRALSVAGESALLLACVQGSAACVRALAPASDASLAALGSDILFHCMGADHADCMVEVAEARLVAAAPGSRLLLWARLWEMARAAKADKCAEAAGGRARALAESLDLDVELRASGEAAGRAAPRL